MTTQAVIRPDAYLRTAPVVLQLGEQVGIHMQRYYTIGFFLNRVLDRVEQLPKIAVQAPPGLWFHILPSTVMHAMRPYVIEEAADHAYLVAENDRRVWRYQW